MDRTRRQASRRSGRRYIPWMAMASLLIILMCIGAATTIIAASDNRTVASWSRIQPAVLLAILSSVSDFAFGTAFSMGVVVTWWLSALGGASLSDLHYIWDKGQGIFSFFSALAMGANARKVALAGFVITMVKFGNGPLLQRATHQRIDNIVTQELISLNAIQKLPEGWIGTIVNATSADIRGSPRGLATAQGWWRNDTMQSLDAPGYYCNGICEGYVPGAGISYNCSTTTQALDLFTANGTVIFAINITMSWQNSTGAPYILLTTIYSSEIDEACTATLTIDTCIIEAGTVEYPVLIQNSTVILNTDKLYDVNVRSTYVYPGDLTTAAPESPAGTLQGLSDFIGYYLTTSTTVYKPSIYSGYSMLADMFYLPEASSYSDYTFKNCHLKWTSPTQYALNSMHNFMFRAALRASNGTEVQTFTVWRTSAVQVFHSEYKYLAAALIITLVGILAILILLHGWWKLGRTVTLCPLETARAFCAPMMGVGDNYTASDILRDKGHIRISYVDGVMVDRDDKASNHRKTGLMLNSEIWTRSMDYHGRTSTGSDDVGEMIWNQVSDDV